MNETIPNEETSVQPLPCDNIKVYTDYDQIKNNLTDPRFVIVDTIDEADIIWLSTHYKDFK